MQKESFFEVLKSAIAGTAISVLFMLILALISQISSMGSGLRFVLAQSLKALSLAVGCLLFLRTDNGWKKGLVTGVLFTVSTFLLFSFFGGFTLSWTILIDLALGLSVGMLSGIAAVNLTK